MLPARWNRPFPEPRLLFAVIVVGVVAALTLAACVPDPATTPGDPGPGATALPAPTARHGDGSVALAWAVDGAPDGATYEWEWGRSNTSTWMSATTPEPEVELHAGLVPGNFHWARVRYVEPGGEPGIWSSGSRFFYADLSLPVVRIDTAGGAPVLDRENYLAASMAIDPNGSGDAAYVGTTEIRGRGNSTWMAAKKPYRLKLSTKSPLLGMPSSRHWVLLANAYDPSHLRNELAFQLSGRTGLAWTPRFRYVEVVLNGSYDGIYMLGEQIRGEPSRVAIDEMGEGDISGEALTGGYLLEFDFRLNTAVDPGFVSGDGVKVAIKEPDPPTPEQHDYIRSYVNAFEASVWSASYRDPDVGYRAYLDVEAFIDWYLIAEIAKQQDSMWSSTFLSKPRNGKLTFGPVWDFDLSMGATNQFTPGWPPEGWWISLPIFGRWVPRLFEDPALRAQTRARWEELRPAFDEVVGGIPATAAGIAPARSTDAARWGVVTAPADTDDNLARWLTNRIGWLDRYL